MLERRQNSPADKRLSLGRVVMFRTMVLARFLRVVTNPARVF